jgi:hypothetical protein
MGPVFVLVGLLLPSAFAQDKPVEIDPNTKIQGGADVPASAGSAGAGARTDNRMESEPRVEQRGEVAEPDRARIEKDKPISARKPEEPRPEDDAAKGESAKPVR